MTTFIKNLAEHYKEFLKEFVNYYNGSVYARDVSLTKFIDLSKQFQLYIIYEYLLNKYEIGIYYDCYTVMIYYANVERYKEQIIQNAKSSNTLSHVLKYDSDLDKLSDIDSFERAIIKLLDIIHPNLNF